MKVTARADYAVRMMVELAAAGPAGVRVKGDRLAEAQELSVGFAESIMALLRMGQLVRSRRGGQGGYWLARPAAEITVGDVVRLIDGPFTEVGGQLPGELEYPGAAVTLREVWAGVDAALRGVLESVTIADVAAGGLPTLVRDLVIDARDPSRD